MAVKFLHIDVETTGTDLKYDDILQIGLVEVIFDGTLYHTGMQQEILVPTKRFPTTKFDKENLAHIYARCLALSGPSPAEIRNQILNFIRQCGFAERPILMGWNLGGLDIPLCVRHGFLNPPKKIFMPSTGRDVDSGDYHHRTYDIQSVFQMAENFLGVSTNELFDLVNAKIMAHVRNLPRHDAIADCYRQTWRLNGVLQLIREHANRI